MDIKFNCSNPACRTRIAVEESRAGSFLACPVCATQLQVPGSLDIKLNCTDAECGQHIVVDVSEAGRFLKCPACGKVLQVPGSPRKSLAPDHAPKKEGVESVALATSAFASRSVTPARRLLYSCGAAFVRLLCGWGIGAALLMGVYLHSAPMLHSRLDAMGNAILSHRFLDVPIVNSSDSRLLYAQGDRDGVNIFRLDLATLKRELIDRFHGHMGPKDFKWLGWAPGQIDVAYFANRDKQHQDINVLRDGMHGVDKHSFDVSSLGIVESGAWLTAKSLVVFGLADKHAVLNFEPNDKLGKYGKTGLVELDAIGGKPIHWATVDSDHSVAYAESHGISTLDITTNKAASLTLLAQGRVEGLQYSPDNGKYLLTVHGTNKDDQHIYQYGPRGDRNARLVRVTDDFSANAKWIQDGTGIAYVGRKGVWHDAPKKGQAFVGTNYFAVVTQQPELCTNLFVRGSVQSYGVDPAGRKIYLAAAERLGLTSLWEYDIEKKSLRDILPTDKTFQFVAPVEAVATNDAGDTVDYYYMPPAGMDPHKKYPAVLDNYLANSYELSGQFLANAGIFYVSADHFGITDWQAAPIYDQTLAVHRALLKNPNIDPARIYISGTSKSTVVACQLVNQHPELWRGVVLLSPVTLPKIPEGATNIPSFFVSTGDQDDKGARTRNERFVLDASRQLIPAQLDYQHAPHAYQPQEFMDCYKAVAKFILTDY